MDRHCRWRVHNMDRHCRWQFGAGCTTWTGAQHGRGAQHGQAQHGQALLPGKRVASLSGHNMDRHCRWQFGAVAQHGQATGGAHNMDRLTTWTGTAGWGSQHGQALPVAVRSGNIAQHGQALLPGKRVASLRPGCRFSGSQSVTGTSSVRPSEYDRSVRLPRNRVAELVDDLLERTFGLAATLHVEPAM